MVQVGEALGSFSELKEDRYEQLRRLTQIQRKLDVNMLDNLIRTANSFRQITGEKADAREVRSTGWTADGRVHGTSACGVLSPHPFLVPCLVRGRMQTH